MINIENTKSKPKVIFDDESNILKIHGRCVLDNMDDQFFYPVFNFIKKEIENNNKNLRVEFFLDYFNTSSHPSLVKIFKLAAEIENSEIVWLYEQNDMEMMEIGNELSRYSTKPITIKLLTE